jgi:hypothetical protein
MDSNRDLAKRIEALESRYDEQFAVRRHQAADRRRRDPEGAPEARHRFSDLISMLGLRTL